MHKSQLMLGRTFACGSSTMLTMPNGVFSQIRKFNRGRDPDLVQLKLKKMAKSAFAFFRGTDHLFAAAWQELRPADKGPDIFCCGDLHCENFGVFAADDGKLRFGVNDFDEAVVAPASFDLVRCTASIFLAAEEWNLGPIQAANVALAYLRSYRTAVLSPTPIKKSADVLIGRHRHTVFNLIASHLGDQASLIRAFTRKSRRDNLKIIRDVKHPKIKKSLRSAVQIALEDYGRLRGQKKDFKVLDVTGRIAGIGGLGLKRYTALIRGSRRIGYRLVDIKEARRSSVEMAGSSKQPRVRSQGLRIITAQRQIQGVKARGLDLLIIARESYRMRDMIPDENRFSLDAFHEDPQRLLAAVELAGRSTGWAHVRGSAIRGGSRRLKLIAWANGPAMDVILSAAIKFAERTKLQYNQFVKSFS